MDSTQAMISALRSIRDQADWALKNIDQSQEERGGNAKIVDTLSISLGLFL